MLVSFQQVFARNSVAGLRLVPAVNYELLAFEQIYFDWAYYGASLILLLFGLVALFTIRDRFYFYFVVFITLTTLFDMYQGGYAQWLLAPGWWQVNERAFYFMPLLIFASLCKFSTYYLDFPHKDPRWHMASKLAEPLLLFLALLFLVLPYQWVMLSNIYFLIAGLSYLIAVWVRSAFMWRAGDRMARNYFLAWSVYLSSIVVLIGVSFTLEVIAVWALLCVKLGYIVVASTLFFTQLDRFNQLQIDRERAIADNHAKSEFLARMSHEIRTPMNGVLGMAELLAETKLTQSQRYYADIVHSSGKALLDIINDILDYSKISAGKLDVEMIDFNLEKLVSEVANLFTATAQEKKVDLICRIDPSLPLILTGDPVRVRQVMVNFLSNAFKFTENGEILVNVERHSVSMLKLSVKDTGIGIPEGKLHNLFESFTQVDSSTSRRYGGTGLGLAICKQLAELMGGDIAAVSQLHVGTEFSFTIPYVEADIPVEIEAPDRSLEGKKILLVDDNHTYLSVVAEKASRWVFDLDMVDNGLQALELMREAERVKKPYDLVTIDIDMPDMNGIELAKTIQSEFPGIDTSMNGT